MKKLFLLAIIGLINVLTIGTLSAAPQSVSQGSSAGEGTLSLEETLSISGDRIGRAAVEIPNATIFNLWVYGPTKSDPGYVQFARGAINALVSGTAPTNVIGDYVVTVEMMTMGQNIAPWDLIMVIAKPGSKTSLSRLVTRTSSPQDPGLYEEQSLVGTSYSTTAIGINNGEFVESGPASQEVDAFLVLVAPKTYTASLEEVRKWIEVDNNNIFSITMEILVDGARALSTISTQGYIVGLPTLTVEPAGNGMISLGFPNGNPGHSYVIISNGITLPMWDDGDEVEKFLGNVTGTERILVPTSYETEFFDWLWQ